MPLPVLYHAGLSVSGHRVLLSVSDPQAAAPGSTEVTATSGMPAQPVESGMAGLSGLRDG
jgi:hypothetical protein